MIFLLSEVQEKLGYNFKDVEVLRQCFTHPSYSVGKDDGGDYERYEFLGDSVLGFVVSDYIFKNNAKNEGVMTEIKKNIVSSKPLSIAMKRLGVEEYMLKNERLKITDSMRENLFEAIIGGIFVDGGLKEAKKFIENNLLKVIAKSGLKEIKDSKSKLNEFSSQNHMGTVKYEVVSKKGKDNLPTFKVVVKIEGRVLAEGVGNSKKNAEQMAAEKALLKLKKGRKC